MLSIIATLGTLNKSADVREKLKGINSPVGQWKENYVHSETITGSFVSGLDLSNEEQVELTTMFEGKELFHGTVWITDVAAVKDGFEYHFVGPTVFYPPKMYGQD